MLSRCGPICCHRSAYSLKLFGLHHWLQQVTLVRFSSDNSSWEDNLVRPVPSTEKELCTLEKIFQERVNSADLSTDETNLAYCLELVEIWLQNSLLEKADWAIQIIEDPAFRFGLPFNVHVLHLLARLRFKQERFQDCADALHRIKAFGLEHPSTYSNLGIVYSAMENYDRASFYFDRAAFYFDESDVGESSRSYCVKCKSPELLNQKPDIQDLRPLYSPDRYYFQSAESATQMNNKISGSTGGSVLKQVRNREVAERRYRKAYDLLGAPVDS